MSKKSIKKVIKEVDFITYKPKMELKRAKEVCIENGFKIVSKPKVKITKEEKRIRVIESLILHLANTVGKLRYDMNDKEFTESYVTALHSIRDQKIKK